MPVQCLVASVVLLSLVVAPASACEQEPQPPPACKPPVGCLTPPQSSHDRGVADARLDLARGILKLKTYGPASTPVEVARVELLATRFGVQHEIIGDGLQASPELAAYAEAYNACITQAIESRHGAGSLEAVTAEALLLEEIRLLIGPDGGREIDKAAAEAAAADLTAGRRRLFRIGSATGIDAVHDELLHRRLRVETAVLHRPDRDIRRFARIYNEKMRPALVARCGPQEWRRVVEAAVVEAARRDIAAGTLQVVIYGVPAPADLEYEQLLNARFGIEVELGGCILPDEYDRGPYDRAMRQEIERRFGEGVLERTQQEARRLVERRGDDPGGV